MLADTHTNTTDTATEAGPTHWFDQVHRLTCHLLLTTFTFLSLQQRGIFWDNLHLHIPITYLKETALAALGPELEKTMTINRKLAGPWSVSVKISDYEHTVLFGKHTGKLISQEEVDNVLGLHAHKKFTSSEARIIPPVSYKYEKQKSILTFRYIVYNAAGKPQWRFEGMEKLA